MQPRDWVKVKCCSSHSIAPIEANAACTVHCEGREAKRFPLLEKGVLAKGRKRRLPSPAPLMIGTDWLITLWLGEGNQFFIDEKKIYF